MTDVLNVEHVFIRIVFSSACKRPQTAAVPVPSLLCSGRKSVTLEQNIWTTSILHILYYNIFNNNKWKPSIASDEGHLCILTDDTQQIFTSALCRCLSSCWADFGLVRSPRVGVSFCFVLSFRPEDSIRSCSGVSVWKPNRTNKLHEQNLRVYKKLRCRL